MKLKATNNTAPMVPIKKPETAGEWRSKVSELEAELTTARQTLTERRAERRADAGAALVFGGNPEAAELEAVEREVERRVDSLGAAVQLATSELLKAEHAEQQAAEAVKLERRSVVATELREVASAVDALFLQATEKLRRVDELLIEFRRNGGIWGRTSKGCITRAALAAGMRPYLETEHVGNVNTLQPLAKQFEVLCTAPSTDSNPEQFVTASLAGEYPA